MFSQIVFWRQLQKEWRIIFFGKMCKLTASSVPIGQATSVTLCLEENICKWNWIKFTNENHEASLFPFFVFNKSWSICISSSWDHYEVMVFLLVVRYPSDFQFLVSTVISVWVPITLIPVFQFNNLPFLTAQFFFWICIFLWWDTETFPPRNTGSGASLTSWAESASLALVGHLSSDGVTIKMPHGVDILHRPASHPIFSYWVG